MDDATRFALNRINSRFYRESSRSFSETRSRPWPGWTRALSRPPLGPPYLASDHEPVRILDVGCGNGRFGRFLADNSTEPFGYYGLDASPDLLAVAQSRLERRLDPDARFERFDLLDPGLSAIFEGLDFDLIVVFGVLHHMPGLDDRLRLLRELSNMLRLGGVMALSFWQFACEARFQSRIVSWSHLDTAGLPEIDCDQLEAGDYLLLWGPLDGTGGDAHGRSPVRYCHHAEDSEIDELIARLDLEVEDSYRSDGAGNALNRYEILRKSL